MWGIYGTSSRRVRAGFQMYECRNLEMVWPIDKYLIIWSLQILFEIKKVDEIFTENSKLFLQEVQTIFSFLDNIINEIKKLIHTAAEIKVNVVIPFKIIIKLRYSFYCGIQSFISWFNFIVSVQGTQMWWIILPCMS